MAVTENITILKIGTQEAVQNIGDLRKNVQILKKSLEDLDIGSREYQDTLDELKVNQNALKDAMYATSSSMDDVAKSASGANVIFDEQGKLVKDATVSYNSYVHAMASLKEEFRSTGDAVKRADLADKINQINDQLKGMDAAQGNFQRNVGNYEGALKGWANGLDAMDKGLKAATGGVNGLKGGVEAFAKSPAIASFTILVSVAMKLAEALKENDTAMNAVKKATAALQPVMDFFGGVLETIAGVLADVIGKVSEFVSGNGLFQKIIGGVVGVGNAIFKFITAPIRGVIAAIKVFQDEGIKGIRNAAKAFGDEMKGGVAFRSNFEGGQAAADAMISGMSSRKAPAKEAGKTIAKEVNDGVKEELDIGLDEIIAGAEKSMEDLFKDMDRMDADRLKREADSESIRLGRLKQSNEERLAMLQEFYDAALERGDLSKALEYDTKIADLRVEITEKEIEERKKKEEEYERTRSAALMASFDTTASILESLADLYEADDEGQKKNAKKIKALRIATATIDTISGAIGAYMQTAKAYPAPWGPLLGAAAAATVTAAGLANIKKIRATNTDGGGSADVSAPSTSGATAVVAAPALTTQVSNVRSVTSASEEDRLNAMASDQRVVLVMSDLEVKQDQVRTQVAESSF